MPGPEPTVTRREIIEVILADPKPAVGTTDISDELDISRQATTRHLDRMEEDGLLHSGEVGPATAWWPTTAGRQLLTESDSAE